MGENKDVVLLLAAEKIRVLCDDYLQDKIDDGTFVEYLKGCTHILFGRFSFKSLLCKIEIFINRGKK